MTFETILLEHGEYFLLKVGDIFARRLRRWGYGIGFARRFGLRNRLLFRFARFCRIQPMFDENSSGTKGVQSGFQFIALGFRFSDLGAQLLHLSFQFLGVLLGGFGVESDFLPNLRNVLGSGSERFQVEDQAVEGFALTLR
jgi:hypothetical protein